MSSAQARMNSIFRMQEANAVWRDVMHLGVRQQVPKGYVWHEEREPKTFSFLHRGSLSIGCVMHGARERIGLILCSGCIFREVSILYRTPHYIILHKTLEPCEVVHFPSEFLHGKDFIRNHLPLLQNLLYSLGCKFGAAFQQLITQSEPAPEVLVSRYLFQMCEQFDGSVFAPGLSQSELAMILGLHRSTLCRVLRTMREQGIINVFTRRKVEITDVKALKALCE